MCVCGWSGRVGADRAGWGVGGWLARWGWAGWDAGGPGGREVVRTFIQPERVFYGEVKKRCRIGNLEKSCSGMEKSCHDMEKSGKMLEKKIQWSMLYTRHPSSAQWQDF